MQTVIDGVLTNYEVVNPTAKKTVLLLHGWSQNSTFWTPLTKLLASDYRYILLDLPSFGGTQNLKENADVPNYTEFVKDFAEKIKLKHFILAGHSFGGQIAGDFAIKYSEQLTKLILIDAAIVRLRGPKVLIKIFFSKTIKPLINFLPTHLLNSVLSYYASPDYVKANYHQRGILHQILKYNLGTKLHLIKVPTEIIWGSEDKVIPYVGKYLVENIPDAKLHLVYGAGHLLHLTHPKKLAATLNQILYQ